MKLIKAIKAGQLMNLVLHRRRNLDHVQALHDAKARGLPLDVVLPFPGTSVNNNYQTGGLGQKVSTLLTGAALAAALLLAGGLYTGLLKPAPQSIAQPIQQAAQAAGGQAKSAASEAKARVRIFFGDQELTPGKKYQSSITAPAASAAPASSAS